MANDLELSEAAKEAADTMTVAEIRSLRGLAGDTLAQWSYVQSDTLELTPVQLVDVDGISTLADRAIWVEDGQGGYWTLNSGALVLDSEGVDIARPTLADILAQGDGWHVAQTFSPATRAEPLAARNALPYLVEVVDGTATVLDWGIEQPDGSWTLASGAPVTDADGVLIEQATRQDILAMSAAENQFWREESFGHNPLADLPVAEIGIKQIDGLVVDYTVQVTDADGAFYVWARNVDRALELQTKYGTARDFNLRNFEVDFETLDEVNSTDDSQFRVELLTPGQFNFAMAFAGLEFQPQMLGATLDSATGVLSYTVSPLEDTGIVGPNGYVSGINKMIDLLDSVLIQYIETANAFAVRMALQGGLSSFAGGISYDTADDAYRGTTDRELIPLFEAIFEAMPEDYNSAVEYMANWAEVVAQIKPDYVTESAETAGSVGVRVDDVFMLQNVIPALEAVSTPLDLRAVMYAMRIDESRLRTHEATDTEVGGTSGTDYFYMTDGDQTYRGGGGTDVYFAGGQIGQDRIVDYDDGKHDDLRLTDVNPEDVTLERDGSDLIVSFTGRTDTIRVVDQFLGELNPMLNKGGYRDSGVNQIVFGDGTIYNRFTMAMEVSKELDSNDVIVGSGSGDVLRGGKGNDVMRGGAGGDYYFYGPDGGQDVINEELGFGDTFAQLGIGPFKAGIDFLFFQEGIDRSDLHLVREGESNDLIIEIMDQDGLATGDSLTIVNQFDGIRNPIPGLLGEIDASLEFDFVSPYMIERFVFENGSTMDLPQILSSVIASAKTDGDDAIYGFLNDNRLDGGFGNDFLSGRAGSDTYVFGAGYGADQIRDNDNSVTFFGEHAPDQLIFQDDLRWTDFDFLRDGPSDTLRLEVAGTADAVILEEFLKYEDFIGYYNRIETLQFGDGTVWTWDKLLQHYVDLAGTDGDDTVYGFTVADRIDGGAGDDFLVGSGGNDTYIVAPGKGSDTILDFGVNAQGYLESGGFERLELQNVASTDVTFGRTALDLIITIDSTGERIVLQNQYVRAAVQAYAIEEFVFTDRVMVFTDLNPEDIDLVGTSADETIRGSNFAEVLDGRGGDDLLIGRDGGDIYKFDVGYGADVIVDKQEQPSWKDRRFVTDPVLDTVEFGGGITRETIEFTKDGNELVITVDNRPDSLRIRDQFGETTSGIEVFRFFDQSEITISDIEELLQIEGGNRGDNLIVGIPDQPNVLDGRQGDDTLRGGTQDDIYAFGAGYGLDQIEETTDVAGVIDRVVFGSTVRQETLLLRRNGDDLLIDLGNGTDVLTIVDGLGSTTVERFSFADGSDLTLEEMRDRLLIGTDGDDQLIGFEGRADMLSGGAGSDALEGRTGDDSYRFGYGDGADSARDTGGIDKVVFGIGIGQGDVTFSEVEDDLLITLAGTDETLVILQGASADASALIESFEFENGTVLSLADVKLQILNGRSNSGMDVLDGTALESDATLLPGAGFDAILMGPDTAMAFGRGDGIDRVTPPTEAGSAEIIFDNLTSSQVAVRVTSLQSGDLALDFAETGDQIILVGGRTAPILPVLRFSDGVVWQRADIFAALIATQQTADSDVIFGSVLDDTITGGTGDDDMRGDAGDDRFVFARGDGRYVIADSAGTDVLEIRGYLASEMIVRLPVASASSGSWNTAARSELVLSFAGSDDEITLRYDADLNGVESVLFGDGTTITRDTLIAQAVGQGTDFDDDISGTAGDETLAGGLGDDTLRGDAGEDPISCAGVKGAMSSSTRATEPKKTV